MTDTSEESKAARRARDNAEWDRQTDLIQRPARMYADAIRQRDAAVDLLRRLLSAMDDGGLPLWSLTEDARALLARIDGDTPDA